MRGRQFEHYRRFARDQTYLVHGPSLHRAIPACCILLRRVPGPRRPVTAPPGSNQTGAL